MASGYVINFANVKCEGRRQADNVTTIQDIFFKMNTAVIIYFYVTLLIVSATSFA